MCEDELICDFAEVYHVLNIYELPPKQAAVLCMGLRNESRVKMHLSGSKLTLEQMLYARMADELAFLSWAKTKDGQKNRNRPKSIFKALISDKSDDTVSFLTTEDFDNEWEKIVHGKYNR